MAIDGMLDQLHDPYSVFLKRDDFRALNEATTGNYGGLGIQIDVRDGWITVVAPLPDTPAERAGIQSGDQIIALDGRSTEGWKNDQAVKQLRGEPGSAVELKVRRVGVEGPLAFKLTRATIHIRSVQVSMMLDDRVGYVLLTPVSETSAQDLTDAVNGLVQKGMKSLVLDLRGNPGGLLDQGVAVSELFLDPGQEVVETRGRAPTTSKTYRDAKPQPWPNLPAQEQERRGPACPGRGGGAGARQHEGRLLAGVPHRSWSGCHGRRWYPAGPVRRARYVHDGGARLHQGLGQQDPDLLGRPHRLRARSQDVQPGEDSGLHGHTGNGGRDHPAAAGARGRRAGQRRRGCPQRDHAGPGLRDCALRLRAAGGGASPT